MTLCDAEGGGRGAPPLQALLLGFVLSQYAADETVSHMTPQNRTASHLTSQLQSCHLGILSCTVSLAAHLLNCHSYNTLIPTEWLTTLCLTLSQDRAALESMRADFEAQLHTARSEVAKAQVRTASSPAQTPSLSQLAGSSRDCAAVAVTRAAGCMAVVARQRQSSCNISEVHLCAQHVPGGPRLYTHCVIQPVNLSPEHVSCCAML